MPIDLVSKKILEKRTKNAFSDGLISRINMYLYDKDMEIVPYLYQVLDKKTSDGIIQAFMGIRGSCVNRKVIEREAATMRDVSHLAVPDFVVRRIDAKSKKRCYPALIEVSSGTIEVYDESIYLEMNTLAVRWEEEIFEGMMPIDSIKVIRCYE